MPIIFTQRLIKISTGKDDRSEGNWTDILMKKDGKWILIGDHEGKVPPK
jgi:hypothetical protein